MEFQEMLKKADDLSRTVSRFHLAQLEKEAEHGRGELAGLTRFEIGEITRLYEKGREDRRP